MPSFWREKISIPRLEVRGNFQTDGRALSFAIPLSLGIGF